MKIIHFLYIKLIDNGISKFTALGRRPLSLRGFLRVIQNPEYTRVLNMPLVLRYRRVSNMLGFCRVLICLNIPEYPEYGSKRGKKNWWKKTNQTLSTRA